MEKKITIVSLGAGYQITVENMIPMEVLGVLRFYEKETWLRMITNANKKVKSTQENKTIKTKKK